MDKVKGKTAPTSKASAPTDNTAEAKTESGEEGNVEPAKYGSIQTIKNGKVTVKMTDGTEVDLKDADLDPDDSVRIETIASIDGISAEDGEKFYDIESIEKQTNPSASYGAPNAGTNPHKIKMADSSSDRLTIAQKQRIVNRKMRLTLPVIQTQKQLRSSKTIGATMANRPQTTVREW